MANRVGNFIEAFLDHAESRYDPVKALEQLRSNGTRRREELANKLKAIMEQITAKAEAESKKIADDVEAAIQKLPPPPPPNLTKAQMAQFNMRRRAEIAKIRGDAASKREGVGESTQQQRESSRQDTKAVREQVSSQLKDSLERARSSYKAAREDIKKKYEAELDKEFDAIKTNAFRG